MAERTENGLTLGSIVSLNSGGPRMTVSYIMAPNESEFSTGWTVGCKWFLDKKLKEADFKPHDLQLLGKPQELHPGSEEDS